MYHNQDTTILVKVIFELLDIKSWGMKIYLKILTFIYFFYNKTDKMKLKVLLIFKNNI